MNKSDTILCALPGETTLGFGDKLLSELISQAKRLELRIEKGANQYDERRRYHLLCNLVEQETARLLLEAGGVESLQLSNKMPDLLADLSENFAQDELPARVSSSLFLPEDLKGYASSFKKAVKKLDRKAEMPDAELKFFEEARKKKLCVVVVQGVGTLPADDRVESTSETGQVDEEYEEELTDNSGLSYEQVITKQVELAIEEARNGGEGVVNFSNHRHDVITEVLHNFVYAKNGQDEPLLIRVVYSDGSEARPFPIYCLKPRKEKGVEKLRKQFDELRVGLLSARHPEMDSKLDFYWFRNQEISRIRTTAETDEACYQKTKEVLQGMREEGSYRLGLYQTGFQPAVVGFYRALAEELMLRAGDKPTLEVTPYYYHRGAYEGGEPWN